MVTVFESRDFLEAKVLSNYLENKGFGARVEGEFLQGGVGEFPVSGLVRVVVPESECAEAVKIVKEWEAKDIGEPTSVKAKKGGMGLKGSLLFMTGLLVGFAIHEVVYLAQPEEKGGVDYNKDGVYDEAYFFKGENIVRAELDRNFDGEVDVLQYFDRRGRFDRSWDDLDFDGRFETEGRYKNNQYLSHKVDADGDGVFEERGYYQYGVREKVRFLKDGKIYKEISYVIDKAASFKLDENLDGKFDKECYLDIFEDVEKCEAL
ncbi:DUF2007 domain-containing protein [Microbulbifer sp. TRSA001]|uniref:putative signal transducing protein n=1 Tax=Microbulbifer sp. TRSA001 TaxID=3243381 RepID=UPI00403A5350